MPELGSDTSLPRESLPYVLGIDLGTNSLGWAALSLGSDGKPDGIIRTGVRIFDAGTEGDISSGRDSSRNVERRLARQTRRLTDRRRRRRLVLFHLLQHAGLLPAGDSPHEVLNDLDRQLLATHEPALGDVESTLLPYRLPYSLRTRALDTSLTPFELGRALYHLGQRRGFASNRKADAKANDDGKPDEDLGKVKAGISELETKLQETGARTLGEYLGSLDPHEERIRRRWTARSMYEQEFDQIWTAQLSHHAGLLTSELHNGIRRAIFFQRPLKSQRHLVGECELEPGRHRAPKALLESQRFRLLQVVNNIRLTDPTSGEVRSLTEDERSRLSEALERSASLTFTKVKRVLGVGTGWTVNLEAGGGDKLLGNVTAARLAKIFGDAFYERDRAEQRQIVEDVLSFEKAEALARRGMSHWGLNEQQAQVLGDVVLEPGYLSISRRAIAKISPYLEQGFTYAEARLKAYPEAISPSDARSLLPPLTRAPVQSLRTIRNPVVTRSLSELRKVVNQIVRTYGKPEKVRIELARDMKNPRKTRQEITKVSRGNEKDRERAKKKILDEVGFAEPSRGDVELLLLAEECGMQCPYTGKNFSMNDLMSGQIDVEHIIPYSLSFDNSFANKTLCFHEENALKGNRSPAEAYSNTSQWAEILARVERFKERTGLKGYRKWQRFQWTDQDIEKRYGGFTERQLNDTRYASRLASTYLAMLYGGTVDQGGTRRIQAGKGQVTARLRDAWGLNGLLDDGPGKSRDDHRHHAVDAVAIALTEPQVLADLSKEAAHQRTFRGGGRLAPTLTDPWPAFLDDVRASIASIVPSRRVNRKVRGPLHEETNYSRPIPTTVEDGSVKSLPHVRKPVHTLTAGEVRHIVDPVVRSAVEAKLADLGGDSKKLENDWATMSTRSGGSVPIRRVRIAKNVPIVTVSSDRRARNIVTGNNHHIEIFNVIGSTGKATWEGRVVTLLEATRRKGARQPVVDRTWSGSGDGKFLFSLAGGDTIRWKDHLYRVNTWSATSLQFKVTAICDARRDTDISQSGRKPYLSGLQKDGCEKVVVDPSGNVFPCHD